MQDYFSFYDIGESFFIDEGALKRKYLQVSRETHPDFYTNHSAAEQEAAMAKSTFNNLAYDTLKSFDKRLAYILTLHGYLGPDIDDAIPQEFLMEMMDINEALMELEFDFDHDVLSEIRGNVAQIQNDLLNDLTPKLKIYSKDETQSEEILTSAKEYFLKNKYLLRIFEKINTFASS